jgi:hypothetical protein
MALLDSDMSVGTLAAPLLLGGTRNTLLAARAGSAIAESLSLRRSGKAKDTVLFMPFTQSMKDSERH